MSKKTFIIAGVITTILVFLLVSVALFRVETKKHRLPFLGSVKDFTLTDSKGEDFGLKDLKNKVWVSSFIFTTCGDICPIMTKNMASLHRSYVLENDVSFVSVSVNPEFDGPEIQTEFATRYKADTTKWHFLTGKRSDIRDLTLNSFKVGSIEEPIFHSSKLILVDRAANIRGYYEGTQQEEVNQLFKDIALLRKERNVRP